MSEQPAEHPDPMVMGVSTLLELAFNPGDKGMVIVIRNNPSDTGTSTSWASRGVGHMQTATVLTELAAKFAVRAEKEAASE